MRNSLCEEVFGIKQQFLYPTRTHPKSMGLRLAILPAVFLMLALACSMPGVEGRGPSSNYSEKFPSGERDYYLYVEPLTDKSFPLGTMLDNAMSYWERSDHVKFTKVPDSGDSTITIRWAHELDGPFSAYVVDKRSVTVGLGDSRCGGTWHRYDSRFVTSLLEHEIGHALGHLHSANVSSVMYPDVSDASYAPVDSSYVLDSGNQIVIPTCTFGTASSFHYEVLTSGGNPLNLSFVYDDVASGKLEPNHLKQYSGKGCHAVFTSDLMGTCTGVFSGSGLLITPVQKTSDGQRVQVVMEEVR